jgi:hypothetical protein
MKDFSQEFYNWMLNEKESLEKEKQIGNRNLDTNLLFRLINDNNRKLDELDRVIKKYKEICFGEEAGNE